MNKNVAEMNASGLFATGRITSRRRDGDWNVRIDGKAAPARKAAGCLLEPGKGDLALLVRADDGKVFVVQVLERGGEDVATVTLPGKATVVAGQGDGELAIKAGELVLSGGVFRTAFKRVSSIAGVVESKAELLRETFRRRYEDIADVKDSSLGRLRCVVAGLLSMRGHTVDVKARKRMRLDGDSVDIG